MDAIHLSQFSLQTVCHTSLVQGLRDERLVQYETMHTSLCPEPPRLLDAQVATRWLSPPPYVLIPVIAQVAKNVTLAGLGSVSLLDDRLVAENHPGNFLVQCDADPSHR
jgi:hypothetical protein